MHDYTIIKREDAEQYLSPQALYKLEQMLYAIESGLKADGKKPLQTFDADKKESAWL